jgi:transcriptional regulator with XRE-family HTH domain
MTKEELKKIRTDLGLTQKEMAGRLGIGRRMYAYVESGTRQLSKASLMLLDGIIRHPN